MTGSAEPFVSLINPDDRMFAAPDDMVRSICRYCREHGQKEPDGDAAVLRCIFDSLALRYREVFDMLCKISPHKIDTLHVIGGGSKNALLNSMTASSTGVTVKAGPAEATAIGNIMVQAIALGCAENIAQMRRIVASAVPCDVYFPENHEMWDEMFRKYQSVVRN